MPICASWIAGAQLRGGADDDCPAMALILCSTATDDSSGFERRRAMEIAIIGGAIELTGDRPFERLDDFISQKELRAHSEGYKRIAAYGLVAIAAPARC